MLEEDPIKRIGFKGILEKIDKYQNIKEINDEESARKVQLKGE